VGDYKVYFVTHNITNDCSGKILDIPIVYNNVGKISISEVTTAVS
jgi:hypothetical protein